MERKIGEIIEFDDVELKVVEVTKEEEKASEACVGCYFFHEDVSECSDFKEDTYTEKQLGSCYKNKRTDEKSVKFIKIRKCDKLEKNAEKVTGVGEIIVGDITKLNKIKPEKVSCWEDLVDAKLATIRGLSAEVKKAGKQAVVHIFLNEKAAAPIAVIDWMPTLKDVVDILRKFGFDIEYEELFNLVEFLKDNIKPREFNEFQKNWCFEEGVGNRIYINLHNHRLTIGAFYFDICKNSYIILEDVLEENNITPNNLKVALKELGWI